MAGKLALIYNNMSVTLAAGLPVQRAISASTSAAKGALATAFEALEKSVSIGGGLTKAMAKYPKVFNPIDVLVVEVGEISGNLAECFGLLSQWYSFLDSLRRMVISKLVFPCVIIHLAVILSYLPALVLAQINIIQYLLKVAETLALFYLPVVVILAVVKLTPKTGFFRRMLDYLILKIPVLGRAVQQLAISRYCRVFNMLYKSGLPIAKCAQKASEYTGNVFITDMFAGGASSAVAGKPVSKGFTKGLPRGFVESWQIGEETGELDNVVDRLVESSTQTSERLFSELGRWLPKLIYFFVCIYIIATIFKNANALYPVVSG